MFIFVQVPDQGQRIVLHQCTKESGKRVKLQGVQERLCFLGVVGILPTLPGQHLATIGRSQYSKPIRVTLNSHSIDNFEDILQQYVVEGWVAPE